MKTIILTSPDFSNNPFLRVTKDNLAQCFYFAENWLRRHGWRGYRVNVFYNGEKMNYRFYL